MQLKGTIAGAGFFAQFQAEAWRRMRGVAITAVADPDVARAKEFAARYGIPSVYESMEAMLAAERPDFVDIVTRPETHRALTELAADQGVHVICQKPMAPSMEDCLAMLHVCRAKGVRLIIHENWRWQPWYRRLRALIDEGRFGTVFYVGFTMRTGDGAGPDPYTTQPYFREMPRLLIYETAVHFLDTFRYLAGEIAAIQCQTLRVNPIIEGEDTALVQIRFREGALGLIDGNRISGPNPAPVAFGHLSLEGDRGAAWLMPDGRLRVGDTVETFDTAAGYRGDSVFACQRHYAECLLEGKAAESEGAEYLNTVALVFACYESAATGQAVFL